MALLFVPVSKVNIEYGPHNFARDKKQSHLNVSVSYIVPPTHETDLRKSISKNLHFSRQSARKKTCCFFVEIHLKHQMQLHERSSCTFMLKLYQSARVKFINTKPVKILAKTSRNKSSVEKSLNNSLVTALATSHHQKKTSAKAKVKIALQIG